MSYNVRVNFNIIDLKLEIQHMSGNKPLQMRFTKVLYGVVIANVVYQLQFDLVGTV